MEGFLLGIASGSTCLAHCIPVLLPFVMGCDGKIKQNWMLLVQFIGGRLLGYLFFAVLAWNAGSLLDEYSILGETGIGIIYLCLAGLMISTAPKGTRHVCMAAPGKIRKHFEGFSILFPAGLGFLTGLNLCPPFLIAFFEAADHKSLLESLFFFFLFFLGTSLYFLPIPFIGLFNRKIPLKTVGQMASVLIAIHYSMIGVAKILGGISIP